MYAIVQSCHLFVCDKIHCMTTDFSSSWISLTPGHEWMIVLNIILHWRCWFAAKMVLLLLSLGFLLSVFPSLKLTTDVFICAYFVCSYQKFHARCRDTVNADNRLCLSRHEEIWWSASTGQPVLSCLPDLIVNLLVILYIFGLSLLLIFSSLILIVAQYLSSGTIPSQFTDR